MPIKDYNKANINIVKVNHVIKVIIHRLINTHKIIVVRIVCFLNFEENAKVATSSYWRTQNNNLFYL
jgi:hypothetical protein